MISEHPFIATLATPSAAGVVLASVAGLTIVVGVLRAGRAFFPHVFGALFVLCGVLPLYLPGAAPWSQASTVAAGLALLVHVGLGLRAPAPMPDVGDGSTRGAMLCLVVALVVAGVLMFHELGSYAGTLQRWEASVVYGFWQPAMRGDTPAAYALDRFRWSSGILSLGAESLLYGAPTYALFHAIGFSPWTLRVAAVVAMLLAIVVVFLLGYRFFGPRVAAAAALLVGLNECALFYGRYGSSPAATVLTVSAAVYLTWLFLVRDRSAWWLAVPCAAALYLATLQYAPGRIVVLVLLGFIPLVVVCQWRRFSWQRGVGVAVLAGAVALVWHLQGSRGQNLLLSGQGEHFFHMTKSAPYVASLCPECRDLLPDERAYQLALLRRWFAMTVPEYLAMIGTRVRGAPLRDWDAPVFPQLYYGPLLVLVVWGVAHSLRHWRSVPHAGLILWVVLATIPLLLANRVDSHRMMIFLVPFALWTAIGMAEAARVMAGARVPGWAQALAAAALLATVLAHDVRILWAPSATPSPACRTLAAEVAAIPGPVAVGALIDPPADTLREFQFVVLEMLERQRLDPARKALVVPYPVLDSLKTGTAPPPEESLVAVERLAATATVVLAPAETFRVAAAALRERGARIVDVGGPDLRLWRLDPPVAAATAR